MTTDPEQCWGDLQRQLRELRRAVLALALARTAVVALGLGLVVAWVGLAAAAAVPLSPAWRVAAWIVLAATVLGCVGSLAWRHAVPLYRGRRFALLLERTYPQLAQRLVSALELWRRPGATALYSRDLLEATLIEASQALAALDRRVLLDRRPLGAALRRTGAVAGLLIVSVLVAPELRAAAVRYAHPLTPYARAPRTRVTLIPGDQTVTKGEDAEMLLRFAGLLPATARVLVREADETAWRVDEVLVGGADSLRYRLAKVLRPLELQVLAGDGATPVHRIDVIDPPRVQRLRVRLEYPQYSALPPREAEDTGDVHALAGTWVGFRIQASKPLASAAIVLDDSVRLAAQVSASTATAGLRLAAAGRYHIELADSQGVRNRDPIHYRLEVIADQPPEVTLAEPGRDMDLPESRQVLLGIEARDDYGVSDMRLRWRLNDEAEQSLAIPVRPGKSLSVAHLWDVTALDLLPEDRLYYLVEVRDNDQVRGPKSATTRQFALRLPSLYELYEEATAAQEEQLGGLEELAEEGRQTDDALERLRRELLRTEELSWQQQQQLEAAIEREIDRAQAVEELGRELQQAVDKMEANGLSSAELLAKLTAIRELMSQVLTPELREALEHLQEALAQGDPAALAEALRQFGEDHRAFQERLDQTIALLRQVQAEQRLEAVVEQARELTRRQELINEELDRPDADARLSAREVGLQRDTGRLQEELRDLGQQIQAFSPPTAAQLQAQEQHMAAAELTGRMGELAAQLASGGMHGASQRGAALAQDLGELAAALQQARDEYVTSQKQALAGELHRSLRAVLELSAHQERLQESTAATAAPAATELAAEQFALMEGTGMVAESVGAASRRTLAIEAPLAATLGQALRAMGDAAAHLGQRNPSLATASQQRGVQHLNEAALLLRQSLENLASARLPASFGEAMERMLGLAEQQAQLNQATRQALQQGANGTLGLQQLAARLAAEQRRLWEALEELRRALRGHRGAEARAQAIEEDMKGVVEQLERQRLEPQTVRQQERILQRLLDASRSIHQQGQDEQRRRSRTGEDQPYAGPTGLPADLGESADEMRAAMRQALQAPYPGEYRAMIRSYYERLYQDLHLEKEAGE